MLNLIAMFICTVFWPKIPFLCIFCAYFVHKIKMVCGTRKAKRKEHIWGVVAQQCIKETSLHYVLAYIVNAFCAQQYLKYLHAQSIWHKNTTFKRMLKIASIKKIRKAKHYKAVISKRSFHYPFSVPIPMFFEG